MCIKCREKSMVNIEFDQINYIATFRCYSCKATQILDLNGTEPPVDKEDFCQRSRKIDLRSSKERRVD